MIKNLSPITIKSERRNETIFQIFKKDPPKFYSLCVLRSALLLRFDAPPVCQSNRKKAERSDSSQKTFTNRYAEPNKPKGRPPLKFDY